MFFIGFIIFIAILILILFKLVFKDKDVYKVDIKYNVIKIWGDQEKINKICKDVEEKLIIKGVEIDDEILIKEMCKLMLKTNESAKLYFMAILIGMLLGLLLGLLLRNQKIVLFYSLLLFFIILFFRYPVGLFYRWSNEFNKLLKK